MSGIFPFISTLYLKQQTDILRCLSSLKFENSLFSNKLFRCIFCSERKVYTAENDQTKYFVQTSLFKSHYSLRKLLIDFATTAINYDSLDLWSLSKEFFTIQEIAGSWFVLDYERPQHEIEYIL